MTRIRHALLQMTLAAAVVLMASTSAFAQTTLNSTTLGAAVNGGPGVVAQQIISLASVSNITVGDLMFVDAETMQVNAIGTLQVTVTRGVNSVARPHASGAAVYTGPRARVYGYDVTGACTATLELYQPHIVPTSGSMYVCSNGEWVRYVDGGYRLFTAGRTDGGTTYTANGAITVQPGLSFINGTTLAMTLANPTQQQNGMVMVIMSTNASAQTLTYTAGFDGGTTARDVATFGGAVGDNIVIQAFNGVWWVLSTRNVTLG